MTKPTQEEIAERAHAIWQESGPDAGDALHNWLEAERQLSSAETDPLASTSLIDDLSARLTLGESHRPEAQAERAAQQMKEARAPQFATHTGPRPSTPSTGKPLWSQPHSS